ncbi:MAG: hypothetical protein EAX96_02635 [Candidatus Lokiarchaeota archaeon]|nr:hypothetical protein [Candidatus Lokiarchaeota archaeon]
MNRTNKSADFVREEFKKYYLNEFIKQSTITSIEEREFGFQYWEGPLFLRHFNFYDRDALNQYLTTKIPRHCYSSAALYELPGEKNINEKNWIGCDFVIDIDADHVDLPCQIEHDEYVCNACGKAGKGKPPKTCSCNNNSFKNKTWVCEDCLKFSKMETIKIIDDFFIPDFGLDPEKLLIKFSGNRGYHIQIQSESFKKLDQDSRREIANYITGKNIDLDLHGFKFDKSIMIGPYKNDKGWNSRIMKYLIKYIEETDQKDFKKISSSKFINEFLDKRDLIIKDLKLERPKWNVMKLSPKIWKKIIEVAIETHAGKIDEPVSTDTKRLLRLPNSLHGKTGLQAKIVSYDELDKFDPLTDTLVFEGEVKVKFKKCPEFTLGNYVYGPYEGGEVEIVNKSAAIFSICKGTAELY